MRNDPRTSYSATLRTILASRLMLAIICCFIACVAVQTNAQTFTLPGNQRGWLDTGLDLAPGTRVQVTATGRVDVGPGWGSHGPEGTTTFANVPGYPADTMHRYGLVLRLTESRTNGADELHNDYSYAQYQNFCAAGGGHLWMTVNDDRPENNVGNFIVTLTRSTCAAASTAAPAPLRGTFRVRLNGFTVHRQTWDDALNSDGWGDEAYFINTATTVDITGRNDTLRGESWGGFTSVFGDTGGGAQIRAGSGTANGGLVTGNSFPATNPWLGGARETGPAFYTAELIQGRTAGIIIPAVFETDRHAAMRTTYNALLTDSRPLINAALAGFIRGAALRTPAQFIRSGAEIGLGALTSTRLHGDTFTGESADRPIGMTLTPGSSGNSYAFIPKGIILTYESAEVIARSDLFGKGRGVVEVRYTDHERLRGDYSLYYLVERVTR